MAFNTSPLKNFLSSLESGKRPKGGAVDAGVPSLGAEHINVDGSLKTEPMKYVPEDFFKGLSKGIIHSDDILIVKDGATTGRVGFVDSSFPFNLAAVNEHVFIARADKAKAEPLYLYYFLCSKTGNAQIMSDFRGAAQGGISRAFTEKVQVPFRPIEEQRRIVDILSRADGILRLRREAQKKTDELIPALFLDMFGDPVTNPKGWKPIKLGDIIYSAKDGPHVSPRYVTDGIPFLSTRHVKRGHIIFEDLKFISPQEAERQWKKCKPTKGDVLYTKGGTTGIAAEIDFDEEIAIWVHIALLKPNHDKVSPTWLESMLNSEYCYRQSQELTHGIANRDLGLTRMINIKAYLPPLKLQKQFASLVKDIKSVVAQQIVAARQTEVTFDSLLSRIFSQAGD